LDSSVVVARTKAVLHLLTIPRRLQIRVLDRLRIVLRLTLNHANDLFFPLICVNPRKSEVSGLLSPSSFSVLLGKPPELNPACLVGMEFQFDKRGRLGGLTSFLQRPFCFLEAGALVLFGPSDLLLEHMSGSKRPVGFAEEFASQQDYVGLSGGDDVLGLLGRCDHANGSGGDSRLAADALGKRSLIAGAGKDA
jgi:hypothetical protein